MLAGIATGRDARGLLVVSVVRSPNVGGITAGPVSADSSDLNKTKEQEAAGYREKIKDDGWYAQLTQGSNADYCARGVATAIFTGVGNPQDYVRCWEHAKELWNEPGKTILHTTGGDEGRRVWGPFCGTTCGNALGVIFNVHVIRLSEWVRDSLLGKDCRADAARALGVNPDEDGWEGRLQNRAHYETFHAIGTAALDVQSVGELAGAAYRYILNAEGAPGGDGLYTVGWTECHPAGWFTTRAAQLQAEVEAIRASSEARASERIAKRAAGIAEVALSEGACPDDADCRKRLLAAAWVAATNENASRVRYEYHHQDFLIASAALGSPADVEALWLVSQNRADAQAAILESDAANALLLQQAIAGSVSVADVNAAADELAGGADATNPKLQAAVEARAAELRDNAAEISASTQPPSSGGVSAGAVVAGAGVLAALLYWFRKPLLQLL